MIQEVSRVMCSRPYTVHGVAGAVLPLLKPLYQVVANSPHHQRKKDRDGNEKRLHPKVRLCCIPSC